MKGDVAHRTVNTLLLVAVLAVQGVYASPDPGITGHVLAIGVYGGLLAALFYIVWNWERYEDDIRGYLEGA